jgi:hypothetical protein
MELFALAGIVPSSTRPLEFLMSRRKVKSESVVDVFWAFVRDNPKLATTLAFELGSLAGTAVRNSSAAKKAIKSGARKVPQAVSDAMPAALSSALKFLPAPSSQSRKNDHKNDNKSKRPRKTRSAAE